MLDRPDPLPRLAQRGSYVRQTTFCAAPRGERWLARSPSVVRFNSESYCVQRSRGYFNCLATGEFFKLNCLLLPVSVSNQRVTVFGDHEAISTVWPLVSYLNLMVSFYRYLFRRLLCLLYEIKAPVRTLPSLANPKIS